MTPNKFVWLTSTVKESTGYLNYFSPVQGGAVGTGAFAVSGTNQQLDYLQALSYFELHVTAWEKCRGKKTDISSQGIFFFPFMFTQSHVSIHIHH